MNDSLPCLSLSLSLSFSRCRSSLMRLSFDRKLFSLTSIKCSLSFILYKMCSIFFSFFACTKIDVRRHSIDSIKYRN